MKKAVKCAAVLSACILAQHLANQTYFNYKSRNLKKRSEKRLNEYFYKWRFGRIRYKIIGKGEPLLLIHGIYPGADMAEWNPIDSEILKSYKVYAIELLGFGRSEKPNLSYSAYLYIRLINDFIRDVIKKPVITAASDYAAAYTVMGCIFNPELYKKLLLISPSGLTKGCGMPSLKDFILRVLLETPVVSTSLYLLLIGKFTGGNIFLKLWRERSIASSIPPVISPSAYYGGSNAKFPIAALFSKYLNVEIIDKLNRISIPMLILSDKYTGLRNASSLPGVNDFLNLKRNTR